MDTYKFTDTHRNLLNVLQGWAMPDDWPSISVATMHDINDALNAGDNPIVLRDHAQHVRSDCERYGCALAIPYFMRND